MVKQIKTERAPAAIGPYSQAIVANGFVFVSGQLPIDPKSGKLIEEDMPIQTRQVIDNLEAILQAAGSSLEKVVRIEVFLKDLERDFPPMNAVYATRFSKATPPARQTIQAAKLPLNASIEISCIALI